MAHAIPIICSNGCISMGFDTGLGYGLCFRVSAIRAEDARDVLEYTRSVLHNLLRDYAFRPRSEHTVYVEFADRTGAYAATEITLRQCDTHVLVHFKRCSSNREGDRELFIRARAAFTDLAATSARLLAQTDALAAATAALSIGSV